MARLGLLIACLFVAVVALCSADHHERRRGYHVRERLHDMSAYELVDFIQSRRAYRYHHGDDSSSSSEEDEEEHEEDHDNEEEHNGDHDGDHDDDDHHDDHVWRFHIGHEKFGAYNYLDHDGHLRGFFIDLIEAVCHEAHKTCYFLLDDYEHCWRGHHGVEYAGIGLLSGWYDGCIGLSPTPDRTNAFNFTHSFTPKNHGALYWRAGEHGENKLDIKGKNVGFADGWACSERCFNRQHGLTGNHEDEYIGHHYKSPKKLVKALQNKEVDAIFTTDVLDEEELGVVSAERRFDCMSGGLSVMARYDSDLFHWWNDAFDHFRASGRFHHLCENAARIHGDHGTLHCLH